ncbi:YhhN-like protein-domain-containing protein [Kalaharituber pfeilii]|nr:YhhN-like protein-domain-containing protein [Kalaharituber pfeilii]
MSQSFSAAAGSFVSLPQYILEHWQPLILPPAPFPQVLTASLSALVISEANSWYPGSALFKILTSLSFLLGGFAQLQSLSQTTSTSTSQSTSTPLLTSPPSYHASQFGAAHFLLVGLLFSLIGDILLIPPRSSYLAYHPRKTTRPKPTSPRIASSDTSNLGNRFRLGMLFFALAHSAYIFSFLSRPFSPDSTSATPLQWGPFLTTFGSLMYIASLLGLFSSTSSPVTPSSTEPRPHAPAHRSTFTLHIPPSMRWMVIAYTIVICSMVATAAATDAGQQRTLGAVMFAISDIFVARDVFGGGVAGWMWRAGGWTLYFGGQMVLAGCVA